MPLWLEILFILLLIGLNGFFSLSEIAIVSSKKARLQLLGVDKPRLAKGTNAAIHLSENPDIFLPTVQFGITLVSTLTGVFSGATLAEQITPSLEPLFGARAGTITLTLVVLVVSYFTLLIGELVPKNLGFQTPEPIAARTAPFILWLSRIGRPFVFIMQKSTQFMFALIRVPLGKDNQITEEEVKAMVDEGTESGIFVEAEKLMIKRVLRLADKPVRAIMTARQDIDWLDANDAPADIMKNIAETNHSIYPVCDGDLDKVIGIARAKDLLDQLLSGKELILRRAMREPMVFPETTSSLQVLERLKQSNIHLGLVVDEYGGIEGIVTAMDVLGAITGDLPDHGDAAGTSAVQRDDGSWLLDGAMPIDDAKDVLLIQHLTGENDFHTLAGVVLGQLNRVPREGDHFELSGFRFDVVDMDGRRVDKIMVKRLEPAAEQ